MQSFVPNSQFYELETDSGTSYYLSPSLREKYLIGEHLEVPVKDTCVPQSADIEWEPNLAKFEARTARQLLNGSLKATLPKGWPAKLETPLAWDSNTFQNENDYVVELSEDDKYEIKAALAHFQNLGLEISAVNQENFPLPNLATRLRALAIELHDGRGFFILRGLDPRQFNGEENAIIFVGISGYIAEKRGRQDSSGNMLVHILDVQDTAIGKKPRQAVYTTEAQPFHSDVVCDILALHTRGTAARGGKSVIASTVTVYNELAATRPDLIHELASSDWVLDTFGRIPAYHQRALLFLHKGKVILNFSRRLLTGSKASPRTAGLPPITEPQAEALDAVHFIAAKHSLAMQMQPGDMRFINNLAVLHCRDAFEDSSSEKRHLVRMWLRNEKLAWPTPPGLEMAWDRIYRDDVGSKEIWEVDGHVRPDHVIDAKRSCGFG